MGCSYIKFSETLKIKYFFSGFAYERGGPTPKALGGLGFRCKLLNLCPITIKSTQFHYLKKVSVIKN
jgi:hypothetical protein